MMIKAVVTRGVWVAAVFGLTGACSGEERHFSSAGGSGGSGATGQGGSGAAQAGGSENKSGSGGSAGTDSCTPGDSQDCYEDADGVSFGGKPPEGQATCRVGARKCNPDSAWDPCVGAIGPLAADTCDAGNDANCNGKPNEGCTCTDGETRTCGSDIGNCKAGTQTCTGQAWGECVGEVKAAAVDTCDDGDDANCNGKPNDSCDCKNGETKQCGTDIGPCEFGTLTCKNGVWPDDSQCMGGVKAAAADGCDDGNDANCNGTPNEGCTCHFSGSKDCGVNIGACKYGKQTCDGGIQSTCMGGVNPTANDTCTGREPANDTNCNGVYGDGCSCVATDAPKEGCGDAGCGQQLCDGATGKLKACSNKNSDVRCNPNDGTQLQVCGPNGAFIAKACPNPATQQCSGAGVCKLKDGELCTAASDCATGVCNQFYTDSDNDTYPLNKTVINLCGTSKSGFVLKSAANAALDCTGGDNNDQVNPGEAEVCDGLDNDCDKKVDRDDVATMPLVNDNIFLTSGTDVQIVASPTVYGLTYSAPGSNNFNFSGVDQANTPKFKDKPVGPRGGGGNALAWNGTSFGIFTSDGDVAANFFKATTAGVVSAGSPASFGTIGNYGNYDNIAAAGMTGGWLIAGNSENYSYQSYAYVISATQAGVDTGMLTSSQKESQVAVSKDGTTYGLVYRDYVNSMFVVMFRPLDKDGVALKTITAAVKPYQPVGLGNGGISPVVTARPGGGFAVAWASGNGPYYLNFTEIGVDGASLCGPVYKEVSSLTWPQSIVPTKRGANGGYLIAVRNFNTVDLHEVLTPCTFAPNPYLAVDDVSTSASLAAGPNGFMLAWEKSGSIFTKALGPAICN
jgi:hypothetical protein